ncbi:hypothetical protein ACGFX7_06430 [Streptomyces harbinensis]|uniref:hypothetical protein n=1 Tax=Streptomyces harbinensis TaxID=1176198 RepID=UPI003719B2A8
MIVVVAVLWGVGAVVLSRQLAQVREQELAQGGEGVRRLSPRAEVAMDAVLSLLWPVVVVLLVALVAADRMRGQS